MGKERMTAAHYLAVDPGETTGWATFNEDGTAINYGSAHGRIEVYQLLAATQPKVLIVEDFELFPWKAKEQSWSDFETVRVIGAIEFWAYAKSATVILQLPNIKAIGYKWAGLSLAKAKRDSHERDAYVHGIYYLQKNGIRKPQQGIAQ